METAPFCVMNGTIGLSNYLDEHNIDAEIFVHEDAIATFNQENRKEYVEASYLLMQQQGIQLVKKYKNIRKKDIYGK